jgi:hypothetical protein
MCYMYVLYVFSYYSPNMLLSFNAILLLCYCLLILLSYPITVFYYSAALLPRPRIRRKRDRWYHRAAHAGLHPGLLGVLHVPRGMHCILSYYLTILLCYCLTILLSYYLTMLGVCDGHRDHSVLLHCR